MSELKTMLERVGDRVAPREGAFERLGRARAARRTRHRIGSGLVALVVAGIGIALAVSALGGSTAVPANGQQTYRDPQFNWTIDYPDGWRFANFHQSSRYSALGIRIANFDVPGGNAADSGPSTGVPNMSFVKEFPADGILVQMWQLFGEPLIPDIPNKPDSAFPVTIADLHERNSYVGGSEPRPLYGSFIANGWTYSVAVWIGPEATEQDRQAASAIVGSWQFLPLQQGTVLSNPVLDFYVLGRPDEYPVGSVTFLDPKEFLSNLEGEASPFYLVRVPQGLYALTLPNDSAFTDCNLQYDPQKTDFYCVSGGEVWGLTGAVVSKPSPLYPDDPLAVLLVRISLDGHVLVSPEVYGSSTNTDIDVTGPVVGQEPSPTYPRGAFQWCPDTANSIPPGPEAATEATDVAVKFAAEYAAGNEEAARALADDGAYDGASWSVAGSPTGIRPIDASSAEQDDLVIFGCGSEVAARSYAVTLDDGTDSSSLDFTLYLIQRPDGWKVWGSY